MKKKPDHTVTMLPTKCCASCAFYFMALSLCRRYPPTVVGAATGRKQPDGNPIIATLSQFPVLTPDGLCGEWKGVV